MQLGFILSQVSAIHTLKHYLVNINFKINLLYTVRPLK